MSNEELALQIKAGNTELYAELWKNTEKKNRKVENQRTTSFMIYWN